MTIWIDGTYRNAEQATVSVFDHGLLYGDGLFEGIRIYRGRVFKLADHIRRLFDGAKALLLEPPMDQAALCKLVEEVAAKDGAAESYIRLLLTRGKGPLGIDPFTCPKPSLIIIVDTIRLYPQEFYEQGVPLIISSVRRNAVDSIDPRIKSLNYLNNVLARIEAKRGGAQEAVMLDHAGHVAECTGDNIFIVKQGVIAYPASHHGALEGITRSVVIGLANKLKLPIKETTLSSYDLYTADEVFLTGTGAELVPVASIDGRAPGNGKPGPVFQQLLTAFHDALANPEFFL